MPHFYCPPENISEDGRFTLPADESRHIAKVLRKKIGDIFSIFDGKGNSYRAVITDISLRPSMLDGGFAKDYIVSGSIISAPPAGNGTDDFDKKKVEINFYQAIPKKQKIEEIIDKLAQIGISSLTPVITARTVVKIPEREFAAKLKRWRAVTLASSKQSGRKEIMPIKGIVSFENAISVIRAAGMDSPTIIAWEGEKEKNLGFVVRKLKSDFSAPLSLNVFIGPEGGFSFDEIKYASSCLKNFFTVGLGDNILRADTAAIMLASILTYELK